MYRILAVLGVAAFGNAFTFSPPRQLTLVRLNGQALAKEAFESLRPTDKASFECSAFLCFPCN